jgi:hypothetical protein
VPRHHRMHGAEQDGGRHGDEHRAHVSTGNVGPFRCRASPGSR